jgi:hypothetical protein
MDEELMLRAARSCDRSRPHARVFGHVMELVALTAGHALVQGISFGRELRRDTRIIWASYG